MAVEKIGDKLEKADDKLEDFLKAGTEGAKKLYARMTDVDSAIKTVSGGLKTGWGFVKKYAGEIDLAMGAVFGVSIGGLVEKATQRITAFGAAAWEAGRKIGRCLQPGPGGGRGFSGRHEQGPGDHRFGGPGYHVGHVGQGQGTGPCHCNLPPTRRPRPISFWPWPA